jgi:hypothetical protein
VQWDDSGLFAGNYIVIAMGMPQRRGQKPPRASDFSKNDFSDQFFKKTR